MGSIRARKENGLLFMDFRVAGQRCREQTMLEDTPANRKRLEKALAKFEAEIDAGTFDYAATFPNSKAVAKVNVYATGVVVNQEHTSSVIASAVATTPTFRVFATQWLAEHQVEGRRSHIKVLRSTLDGHLLLHFGDMPMAASPKPTCWRSAPSSPNCPGAAARR